MRCVSLSDTVPQEYWKNTHGIVLRFPKAFGVKVGSGDAIFPAEVCSVIEGQRYKKQLSPSDVTAFIAATIAKPQARLNAICNAVAGRVNVKSSTGS